MGKSTLVNVILGGNFAQTSKTPGKTKTLTFFPTLLDGVRIVDCPGYGYASVGHQEKENWRKFMEMYLRDAKSLHRVVMLVDMTSGIQQTDQALIDILIDKQTPINLVMTKSDKCPSKYIKQTTLETIDKLKAKGLL